MHCILQAIGYYEWLSKGGDDSSFLLLFLLYSFIGKNPMSDRTRIHVHSLNMHHDTTTAFCRGACSHVNKRRGVKYIVHVKYIYDAQIHHG